MTDRYTKNKMLERGALMLEALAMLGLIAVVTPTMYKKSAERTLEVEDINTADTVRTYTKAVEGYMSENMSTIMANFEDGGDDIDGNVLTITPEKLKAYLPYGFDTTKTLYDYREPKIRIYKNGTMLTSFILFPAKSEDGIGQERTSRIASLIGSAGGYVTDTHKARGVGGVWSLNEADYTEIFNGDDSSKYSLVTISPNVVSGNSDGGLDNSKYLQRTYDTDEEWRNTMRTDLYLGGYVNDDEFPEEHVVGDHPTDKVLHNIRNINSLIVGSEFAGEEGADTGNYGLYIYGGEGALKKDAFIAGTLAASANNLIVNDENMRYGGVVEEEGGEISSYNFEITSDGDMINTGNLQLATSFTDGVSRSISIGGTGNDGDINILKATSSSDGKVNMSLASEDIFSVQTEGYSDTDNTGYDPNIMVMNDGYKKISQKTAPTVNGDHIDPGITNYVTAESVNNDYKDANRFPVEVDSNMLVNGVLAAGQIDVQKMRMASLEAGSTNIDDAEKWLKVDASGVDINSPTLINLHEKTKVKIDKDAIKLQKGGDTYDTGSFIGLTLDKDAENNISHQLTMGSKNVDVIAEESIDMRTDGIRAQLGNSELLIGAGSPDSEDSDGVSATNHRVLVEGGHVDMVGSNLRVIDNEGKNVLSVRGGSHKEPDELIGDIYNDLTTIRNSEHSLRTVNLAVHGNAVFTNKLEEDATDTSTIGTDGDNSIHYLTLGAKDNNAAVNIIGPFASNLTSSPSNQKVMAIDLDNDHRKAFTKYTGGNVLPTFPGADDAVSEAQPYYTLDPGTIYVRKGLLDIAPDKGEVNDSYSSHGSLSTRTANDGTGVIRASRFVANNVKSNGDEIKVPLLITEEKYRLYNGSDPSGRYDTYMVNPAYTSVMNDIKLVSRGGARLSDIMPDFITKGVYVVKNDYDDTLSNLSFKLASNGKEITGITYDADGKRISTTAWASPYSGVVPMPQCPPGYSRVISITPTGFQMGQAGTSPSYVKWGGYKSLYLRDRSLNTEHLDDIVSSIVSGTVDDPSAIADYIPTYAQPEVYPSNSPQATIRFDDGVSDAISVHKVTDIDNFGVRWDYRKTEDGSLLHMYNTLMSQNGNSLIPLNFQQNTYLKALVVKISDGTTTSYGSDSACSDNDHYCQAWAVLLGYIYPKDVYKNFVDLTGFGSSHDVTPSDRSYYWNIFPVLKTSIEAYATTYCYFDRGNTKKSDPTFTDERLNHIYNAVLDPADSENFEIPHSYEKNNSKSSGSDYWKNLNDPTMKYNESW